MPRTRRTLVIAASAAALALVPPLATALGEPFLVSLFSRVLIYALAAVSLDLILGYGGLVSFGHAAFFGVGAYTVGILAFHAEDGSPVLDWHCPSPAAPTPWWRGHWRCWWPWCSARSSVRSACAPAACTSS